MAATEKERHAFAEVWDFVWPAFGATFGLTVGGLAGGAWDGLWTALLGAMLGLYLGLHLGHALGHVLFLILRPWLEFFDSGQIGPLGSGLIATGLLATWALRTIDDTGLAIVVSCLGFAIGDFVFLLVRLLICRFTRAAPKTDSDS